MKRFVRDIKVIDYMDMRVLMDAEVESVIWSGLCDKNFCNDSAVRYWFDDERQETWEEHKKMLEKYDCLEERSEFEYKAVGIFEDLIEPYATDGEVLLWISW